MDRFSIIIDAAAKMARCRLLEGIYGLQEVPEAVLSDACDAQAMAHWLGVQDARRIDRAPGLTLRIPFSDPGLASDYSRAFCEEADSLDMQRAYPSNPNGHTLYCPNGCNAMHTTAGYDECGACGARMTPHCLDDFEDSLVSAGQLM